MNFNHNEFTLKQYNTKCIIEELECMYKSAFRCNATQEAECINKCLKEMIDISNNRIIHHPSFPNPQLCSQLRSIPTFVVGAPK